MRDKLTWVWHDSQELLEPWNLQQELRHDKYRTANTLFFCLESTGWQAATGKLCVRYARVCSAKVDIATLMIYPTASANYLPIFASEWLIVGSCCQRVILDIEPATVELSRLLRLNRTFVRLGERWHQHLPTALPLSEWFQKYAQLWAIHSSCEMQKLALVRQAFREYLKSYINYVNKFLSRCVAGTDAPEVMEYKLHHARNFPGYSFLCRVMGEEWTNEYLYKQHFGVVHEPISLRGAC